MHLVTCSSFAWNLHKTLRRDSKIEEELVSSNFSKWKHNWNFFKYRMESCVITFLALNGIFSIYITFVLRDKNENKLNYCLWKGNENYRPTHTHIAMWFWGYSHFICVTKRRVRMSTSHCNNNLVVTRAYNDGIRY